MIDDKLLQKKSRWNRVSDVPDLPVKDFEGIRSGHFSLVLDKSLVSQLAVIFGGRLGSIVYLALRLMMIGALVGLIFAVRAGYLLAVWGVLISLIILALSAKVRWLLGAVVILSPIGLAAAIIGKHYLLASMIIGLMVPLLLLWVTNRVNQWLVRRAALNSEPVFLYMYERGVFAVKDNQTKQVYWCRDSTEGSEFR